LIRCTFSLYIGFRRSGRTPAGFVLQANAGRDEGLLDGFLNRVQNSGGYDGDNCGARACKQKSFHRFLSG
ncbi:MAG: hypothetical protein AB7V13_19135, partial [Pseudorhodoplanes sp.]